MHDGLVRRTFTFSLRSTLESVPGRVGSVSTAVGTILIPCAPACAEALPHRYGSSLIYSIFGTFGTLIFSAFAVAAVSPFCYLLLKQFRRDLDVEFWAAMTMRLSTCS